MTPFDREVQIKQLQLLEKLILDLKLKRDLGIAREPELMYFQMKFEQSSFHARVYGLPTEEKQRSYGFKIIFKYEKTLLIQDA